MKTWFRRLILYFIGLVLVYLLTEWVVYGFHYLVFQPNDYITYINPLIHTTKYFAIGIVLVSIGFRHIQLTKAGKSFLTVILIASILGFVVTSLWFNAADEERIVKFRVFHTTDYSWDEVESVSTHVYREDTRRSVGGARSSPRQVKKEYNLYLTDDTSINVWSDLDSIYTLHQLVSKKDLPVEHLTEAEYFDQRFINYFGEELERAYVVFGIK